MIQSAKVFPCVFLSAAVAPAEYFLISIAGPSEKSMVYTALLGQLDWWVVITGLVIYSFSVWESYCSVS